MGFLSSLFGGNKPDENQQSRQDKKNFDILKYDGIRARSIRQLPYAIKCFEQAIAIEEEPETLRFLATSYVEAGRLDDARNTLERLTTLVADDVQALLSLAHVCFMQEDYQKMDESCQKAIALDDKNKSAYYLAAQAAHGQEDDIRAVAMLTEAIALDDGYIAARQLRAEILWQTGQAQESADDIEKILSIQPENEEALLLKGKAASAAGNTDEAISLCDQIIGLDPFGEKPYLLKGELLTEKGELDKAIETYDEAIELMPQNARLFQGRAHARLLKGDTQGAEEDTRKSLEANQETEIHSGGNPGNFGMSQGAKIY